MKYIDPIYGEFEIDALAERIIGTPEFQRLKRIHQNGASFLANGKLNTSRYEHSIGVYHLVKRFGGSIKEQIAGLLHDIGHTAFSHVVDHLMELAKENYHEQMIGKFMNSGNMVAILASTGTNPSEMSDLSNFNLVKAGNKDLSCDRLDYCLRDLFKEGHIRKSDVMEVLNGITVDEGALVCKDVKIARRIAELVLTANLTIYFNPAYESATSLFVQILKNAMKSGIVKQDDFLLDDYTVMQRLLSHGFEQRIKSISKLSKTDEASGKCLSRKMRIIDPFVKKNGVRLSEKDSDFAETIKRFETNNERC